MRAGAPSKVLATSAGWAPIVASWLGSTLLAADVPILSGRQTVQGSQMVPERVTLTVPAVADGRSWVPGEDPTHPLARFGQRLAIDVNVTASRARSWRSQLGWFQVQDWSESADGATVDVECVGLLQRPSDDRLPAPSSPASGSTFVSEFRRLMSGGIPVSIDAALVDRACPLSFAWAEDRLGALYDLADAWPARILTGGDGIVRVLPPLPDTPTPVLTWTDGQGGVLMSAPASDTRDGIYTSVVVRSSATDATNRVPVQAEAFAGQVEYQSDTYGVVRKFYSSPLIATDAQAQATAQTMLADSLRPARQITVTLPPDPRVELGDAVSTVWDGVTRDGWVVGYTMPLTATGGAMTVTVGLA